MTDRDRPDTLSRRDLDLAVAARHLDGGLVEGVGRAPALVVSSATSHLDVRRVARGDVRRADVWTSPAGVVALARQDRPDTPGPVVALPPHDAHQVWVSALGLDPGVTAAASPVSSPDGAHGLLRDAVDGKQVVTVVVVDHEEADRTVRWIVCDTPEGRVADLDAPTDPAAPLSLAPIAPMALALALSGAVSRALTSDAPLEGPPAAVEPA